MSVDINRAMSTVKTIRAKPGRVTVESERAATRYVLLLEELRRELNGKRGWQTEVAKKLGIDQGYVSRLISRERVSVGLDLVERACANLHLKHEFFHGRLVPKSYLDFVGDEYDAPYPAWRAFAAQEKSMSLEERATLASIRFASGDPTPTLYQVFLLVMRGHVSPSKRDAVIAENERLRRENEEDDNADD